MQLYAKFLGISVILLFSIPIFAASDVMKPFPPAEEGYKRMVIHLQPLADEENNKFETIIRKTLKVDCSKRF